MIIFAMCLAFAAIAQQAIPAEFPKAAIAGKSAGTITIEEIQTAGILTVNNADLKITGFTFAFKVGEQMISLSSKSDKITDEMISSIRSINKGDRLHVEKIQATTPDGKIIELQALPFLIR